MGTARELTLSVQDPEAFFGLADADKSGDISFEEWEHALGGSFEAGALRVVFDEMDYDKSGSISLSEFTETRNLIRNFVKESKVESLIVEVCFCMPDCLTYIVCFFRLFRLPLKVSFAQVVTSVVNGIRMQKSADAANEFCAKQTMGYIAELTLQNLTTGLADIVPRALAEAANEVKASLLDSMKNPGTDEQASEKFSDVATASYGDVGAFHKGLEAIGLPHPKILQQMKAETCEAADSLGT